jgi:hypothetical protein
MDKKINNKILELTNNIDPLDLTDRYRVFHPTIAHYAFFSVAHGTFSKIEHILNHRASLKKYKKSEITP